MIIVEHLLEEFDADTPFATPVPRPLKFVIATDVLPILVQALSEPGSDQNGTSNTGTSSPSTTSTRNSTGSNTGLNNNSSSNGFGSSSSSSGSSSGGSSDIGNGELNTQSVDTKPTIAVVGSTKIIADPRANSIIVLGSAEGARQGVRYPRPARRAPQAGRHPHGHRRAVLEQGQRTGLQLPAAYQPRQPAEPVQRGSVAGNDQCHRRRQPVDDDHRLGP